MSTATAVLKNTKWAIDPTHSEIQFKVKHLLISTVTGSFTGFTSTVETEGDDFNSASIVFDAEIDSISTHNAQRDAHLKADDFFDIAHYPNLHFQSTKLEKLDDENFNLQGTLTIRDISKNISLSVEFGGITKDPWGNIRAGFSVNGKINRRDFGLNFNAVSETGGLVLGEDIRVIANVQFVKQADQDFNNN